MGYYTDIISVNSNHKKYMKFTIEESILLFGFLPTVGDYETLKETMGVRDEQMIFNERETREYDIEKRVSDDGRVQVTFNKEASEGYFKEIKFPPRLKAHITSELERLNDEKKLNEQILTLYEKFVLGIEEDAKTNNKSKANNTK